MDPFDLKDISELERGNHLCCLYETEEEQVAQLVPLVLKGLGEREKVVYYADPFSSERLLGICQTEFPAIAQAVEAGRILLLTDRESFTRDGIFSPDKTISSLRLLEKRALEEGFAGLRFAAEATWLFGGINDSTLYLELESKLGLYMPISRCALLMQYDRWVFDPAILLDVLAAHPVVVSGSEVYENIYYLPPEELLKRDITSTSLRLWLATLKSYQRESKMLRDSEANFRGIFNAVNDAIFILDIETFEFVDANQKAQEMFGMTLEEIRESPPGFLNCDGDSIDGEEAEKSLSILDGAARGEPQTVEWVARGRDGGNFWVEGNIRRAVIGGEDRLVSTVRDISKRKRDEEALRETRDYLDSLIAYANAPIIVWDPSRKITRFNHAFEHLTGYSADEVVGKGLELLFPEGSREASLEKIGDTLSGEHWESVEIPVLDKDGKTHIALWNSANIYDSDGETLLATIAQGQDISERKAAEEALRLSEERYRELVENANSIILKWDAQGRLTFFNEYAQRFFGYSEEEVLGGDVSILVPEVESDGRDLTNLIDDLLGHPDDYVYNENENVCKDGKRVWVAWTNKVVMDQTGNPVEVLAVGVDTTDRRRMEKELRDYAHTISHDLCSPLATVQGYAQAAREACSEGDLELATESLESIRRLTRGMSDMIESLLEYSEAGKPAGKAGRVELGEALQGVIADHESGIRDARVKVITQAEYPALLVDLLRLRQVLTNLLSNAIRSVTGRGEPCVKISAVKEGEYEVTVYVEDNGQGIDPVLKGQIFEPFRSFTSDGVTGTGIGLATARRAVEGWGGSIRVESEPGKGASFFFTAPAG